MLSECLLTFVSRRYYYYSLSVEAVWMPIYIALESHRCSRPGGFVWYNNVSASSEFGVRGVLVCRSRRVRG